MASRCLNTVTPLLRPAFRTQRSTLSSPLLRSSRASRQTTFRQYATETSSSAPAKSHTPAVLGGLAGGTFVLLFGYGWYHFSGAKTFVNTLHSVSSTFHRTTQKATENAPEPNEALAWLRQTAQSYAGFVPGAKGVVDRAFDDLDKVHEKHGGEVDELVRDVYGKLKKITKDKGVSLDAAGEAMSVLSEAMGKIMSLASDAGEEILNNHPDLKKSVGGNVTKLREMGDQYGPEAKKQVDETWEQIRSIVSKGLTVGTIPEIKKLVEEKMEVVRKYGDEAFSKGLEQAKPYLDKVPQAKELIEKNKDALKQGDAGALFQKVKEAADSGSTDNLSKYVEDAVNKTKQSGSGSGSGSSSGGLEKYLSMIPGGSDIAGKLQKLQEVGQKHGKEAEDLLKSTMDEIQQVLQKKVKDAEGLAEKAGDESKKS